VTCKLINQRLEVSLRSNGGKSTVKIESNKGKH